MFFILTTPGGGHCFVVDGNNFRINFVAKGKRLENVSETRVLDFTTSE